MAFRFPVFVFVFVFVFVAAVCCSLLVLPPLLQRPSLVPARPTLLVRVLCVLLFSYWGMPNLHSAVCIVTFPVSLLLLSSLTRSRIATAPPTPPVVGRNDFRRRNDRATATTTATASSIVGCNRPCRHNGALLLLLDHFDSSSAAIRRCRRRRRRRRWLHDNVREYP